MFLRNLKRRKNKNKLKQKEIKIEKMMRITVKMLMLKEV